MDGSRSASTLSSSLAGPVGKWETRLLRFPLFHRAVLVLQSRMVKMGVWLMGSAVACRPARL